MDWRMWGTGAGALVVGAILLLPGIAVADQGVAINLGSIQIEEPLTRGESYRLPQMEVTNPGTEVSAYEVTARSIGGEDSLPVMGDWFVISPGEFKLNPGATQSVTIALSIPLDADAGVYSGLVGPSLLPSSEGASLGAGAAAKVTFEVPLDPTSLTGRATSLLDDHGDWVLGLVGLLLVVALAVAIQRRFTFRVERK